MSKEEAHLPETTLNVDAFYAALDSKKRSAAVKSWRELARDLDITPSTFTRLAQGHRPDVDTFATLLRWLDMPAQAFMTPHPSTSEPEPDALLAITSHLRARRDMNPEQRQALENVIQAAYHSIVRE
jgi:transcriptional regulator with XRE-family HTH domain